MRGLLDLQVAFVRLRNCLAVTLSLPNHSIGNYNPIVLFLENFDIRIVVGAGLSASTSKLSSPHEDDYKATQDWPSEPLSNTPT